MLNLSLSLKVRLANAKAGAAYRNQIEATHRGSNDNGKTPVIYSHDGAFDRSFRRKGYADELTRSRGQGYYTDSFQEDTMRGVVYQLPARNGTEQFLAGAEWSVNDETFLELDIYNEVEEAARAAESIAECTAERYREDDARSRAESDIEELRREIKELRTEIKELRVERAAVRACGHKVASASLLRTIRQNKEEIQTKRRRVTELTDNHWAAVA